MTDADNELALEALPMEVARSDSEWEDLVLRVAVATGLDPELPDIALAAQLTSDHGAPWSERVVRACAELGLRASVLRSTVAAIAAGVGPEHPAVTRLPGADEWVVLTDRRGRSVRVEIHGEPEARWISRGRLAAMLDPETLGAVEWVAVDPGGLFTGTETESAHGGADPRSPLARLRSVLKQERYDVGVVLVYAVGVGVLTLVTPITVQALVSTVAFGRLLQPLFVLALLLLAGLSFAAVLRAMQTWVVEILQRRLFLRLVSDLSQRLPRVQLRAFDRAHGPELVNRFFDLFTVQKAASRLLIDGLEVVLTALVGMVVLAFYHPVLLAFDVLLVALLLVILLLFGRGATETAVKESKAKYRVAGWLEELARQPVAFKLAGGPRLAADQAQLLATEYLGARKKHFRVVFRQTVATLALHALASTSVLAIGGWLVIERQMTLGQLVAAELIVTAVVASFSKLGKHLETSYDLLAALDKLGQLIELPLERTGKSAVMPAPSPKGAHVAAHGVSFAYEGGEPVIDGLDLELAPGDRVALCGAGGAGRSALVDLLTGLREPSRGRIEVEGCDIEDVHPSALRARVAVVRGAEIVVGTIAENVAFGRPAVGPIQVREALRAVDLLDEIARLPEGVNASVTPTGAPLSTGQGIRLTLARAIAGRPSLLVIDRALDALDPATRRHLLAGVASESAPWTLLVVTDDPSIIARCGRALQLDDGRLTDGEV